MGTSDPGTPHLWDVDHGIFSAHGNFYAPVDECYFKYETWSAFIEEHGDRSPDYNLLTHWDWNKDENDPMGELDLFFNNPRKAQLWSVTVGVHADDEPSVRIYLQAQLDHLMRLWEPLSLAALVGSEDAEA